MVLEGLVYTPNQQVNQYFSDDVGESLFIGHTLENKFGHDLVSRNIQVILIKSRYNLNDCIKQVRSGFRIPSLNELRV